MSEDTPEPVLYGLNSAQHSSETELPARLLITRAIVEARAYFRPGSDRMRAVYAHHTERPETTIRYTTPNQVYELSPAVQKA